MFLNKYLENYSKERVLAKAVFPEWKVGTLKTEAVDL